MMYALQLMRYLNIDVFTESEQKIDIVLKRPNNGMRARYRVRILPYKIHIRKLLCMAVHKGAGAVLRLTIYCAYCASIMA